jgi:iron complex outermembrane receptor protein
MMTMMKGKIPLLTRTAILALCLHGPAALAQGAQEATATPPPPGSTGDIVVTARRRAERLQDVPVAITAFSGDALASANITRTEDLMTKTPGLSVQPSSFGKSAVSFGIRSQRQYLAYMTVDQSVGVYQDEVYQSRTNGLNSSLFDLDSVQVLKGPQGTLFGRNTPGGAILFTSKRPTDDFEGYARLAAGNYATFRGEGAINIPVSEILQVRLAGAFSKHDGYTRNLVGAALDDEDSHAYRASVKFQPSDSIRNILIVGGMREEDHGQAFKALPLAPAFDAYYRANGIRLPTLAITDAIRAQLAGEPYNTVSLRQRDPGIDVKSFNLSNTTEINLSDTVLLKNIFGYRFLESHNRFDFDGTPSSIFVSEEDQRSRQYSDELQLQASLFDKQIDLIVGAFYFTEKGDNRQNTNGRRSGGIVRNTSYAGFLQATWHTAFLPGLSLTAGGRLTRDERYFDAQNFAPSGACRIPVSDRDPTVVISPCSLINKASFTQPTWTFTADYRVSQALMVYGTYRRGYRSGGFTFAGTRRSEFEAFRPEIVDDVEIGFKSNFDLAGGPARINAAAYRDVYNDIQRTVSETRNEGGGPSASFPVTLTKNAASATIKGFEIDANWTPVTGLTFGGFWNYSKPQYKNFLLTSSTGAVLDYSNNPFSFAPLNTYGASIDIEVPVSETAGMIGIRFDMYHQDVSYAQDTIFDPAQPTETLRNTALGVMPAYTIFNARVDWKELFGRQIDLGFFVKNLTDEKYLVGQVDLTTSASTRVGMLSAPRTIGAEIAYHF